MTCKIPTKEIKMGKVKYLISMVVVGLALATTPAKADGMYVLGAVGASNPTMAQFGAVPGGEVAVGYEAGYIRSHLSFDMLDVGNHGPDAHAITNKLALAMTYVQLPLGMGFTPFVGVGLGVLTQDGRGSLDDYGLAYAVGGGASYKLNDRMSLVGEYRYVDTDVGVGTVKGHDNYKVHVVTTGLKVNF